ncbi:MAG: hypothetical protein M3345_02465, partial [Actinomycetota bacterium]|nr:hypothetical protein [Actinomycetota bacterium]
MAIKGKKKSQSRGAQGQRRPAAAPRPTYSGPRHVPWYKTQIGRIIAIMVGVFLVSSIFYLVNRAQTESQERTERRKGLEDYTGQLAASLQTLSQPVTEMGGVAPAGDAAAVKALKEKAAGWLTALQQVQTQLQQAPPPPGLDVSNTLVAQAVGLYGSAVQSFGTAPSLEGRGQEQMLASATDTVARASSILDAAIALLDAERDEVGLSPSALTAPKPAPPPAVSYFQSVSASG